MEVGQVAFARLCLAYSAAQRAARLVTEVPATVVVSGDFDLSGTDGGFRVKQSPNTQGQPPSCVRLRHSPKRGQRRLPTNDSEFAIGVVGAAVPIASPNGRIIACLSISAPKARKSLEEVALLVSMMQAAALRITKILSVIGKDEVEEEAETKPGRRKRS